MNHERNFIIRWMLSTAAIIVASYLLSGVSLNGIFAAIIVALVLGLLNTLIKPVLIILTLPLTLVTLGLFTWVINALLIQVTSAIVPGFQVKNFGWALLFALVLALFNTFIEHWHEHKHREHLKRGY